MGPIAQGSKVSQLLMEGTVEDTVRGELERVYRRTWWALMLRGWLGLAVGIFILVRPLDSVAALALVIAFWALFAGSVEVVHGIELARAMKHWWVLLLSGLIGIGFGIAALIYYPALSLAFAVVWFALWLLLSGALALFAAMKQRRLGLHWGWPAVFGLLSVAASVFALLAPPVTLVAIMGLIAAFSILTGALLVVGAFKLRSLAV